MRETTYTKTRTIISACTALLLAAGAWHVAVGRLVSFRARSPERIVAALDRVDG